MAYEIKEPGTYFGTYIGAELRMTQGDNPTPIMALNFHVTHIKVNEDWVEVMDPFKAQVTLWLNNDGRVKSMRKLDEIGFNGDYRNPVMANIPQGTDLICTNYRNRAGQLREGWDLPQWAAEYKVKKTEPVAVDQKTIDMLTAQHRMMGRSVPPGAPKPPAAVKHASPFPRPQAPTPVPAPAPAPTHDTDPDLPF